MHDPVQPRPHEEYQVRLTQRRAAGGAHRQRIVVGQDALAHGRGQERQLGALDEFAHLVLGPRPGHALADDDQRLLRGFQGGQRGFHGIGIGQGSGWFADGGGGHDFVLVNLAVDDVVGHVQIHGSRPAK